MLLTCDYQSEALFQNVVDAGLETVSSQTQCCYGWKKILIQVIFRENYSFFVSPNIERTMFSMSLWLYHVNEDSKNMCP